ncbi:MAG TPA: cell wall hydrolase [Lachnospiraceae bacterium]|nr:cell wall hydrolase [Lachnospiraceae bacterium]
MKSTTFKQAALLFLASLAIAAWANGHLEVTDQGHAQGTVSGDYIFYEVYAGAAEVLEVNLEPTEDEIQQIRENNSWKNPGAVVMANVTDSVNVRQEPDENADKVGKFYKDCGGYIIEYTEEWTKIESGNLIGWVNNDYLTFGDEAQQEADEVGSYQAVITADSLRVRKEASTEAGVYGTIAEGDVFEVVEEQGEWLVIDYEGASGYISADYADVSFCLDYGETLEEIAEREAAEEEAKRFQYYGVYATEATDVELLGALIQCEAGNQPYEGMVAVGAVVMNRVRSGAYPNTIYGVIYASGQFTPAGSGQVDHRIANGVSAACIQAAQDAINGYSNVGTATHFRPTGSHDGIVIGGHVFW